MSAVDEARQLYTYLEEVEEKLASIETEADTAKVTVLELYTLTQDLFMLLRRLGLPEDIQHAVVFLQRFIMLVHAAYTSAMALYTATGPIGWVTGGLGILTAGASLASMYDLNAPRY